MHFQPTRRHFLNGAIGFGVSLALPRGPLFAQTPGQATDVTFLFTNDVHACLVSSEKLSPNCAAEGKTDANLLRHIAALNDIEGKVWPREIGGIVTGLAGAGTPIGRPHGLVMGGDMTDDGGGQLKVPGEGWQIRQFSSRYTQGSGTDQVHFPVYNGLGNHDLDQDSVPPNVDWYRREMRDYIEMNHRPSVFYKPPVPAVSFDVLSDSYSWGWQGLHLVQLQRFGGDTAKGAISGLDWLSKDLATYAGDGRPVILFQHYGWDPFSTERWDSAAVTYDDHGTGAAHWWTEDQRRALLARLKDYNVIGIFHGHEHDTPMIYRREGIDLFKPVAAYKGGFAVARVTDSFFDVVLVQAVDGDKGEVKFTHAFSRSLNG